MKTLNIWMKSVKGYYNKTEKEETEMNFWGNNDLESKADYYTFIV